MLILSQFVKGVATGTIKKAITIAVQSAIRTALEHADDQLVEVRNTMDEAKRSDETTRQQALKDLYARKKRHDQEIAAEKQRSAGTGTFKIVIDRDDQVGQGLHPKAVTNVALQINPGLSHDSKKSAAQRMFKVEDLAASGKEWRSPAFDLLDEKHPAVTGKQHPEATPGVGHKNIQTSAVAAARGEQLGVPKDGVAPGSTATGAMGTSGTTGSALPSGAAAPAGVAGTTQNALGQDPAAATSARV